MLQFPRTGSARTAYSPEVKRLCYEVWAYICNRSPSKTAEYVANVVEKRGEEGLAFFSLNRFDEISHEHIIRWNEAEDWESRRLAEMHSFIPGIKENAWADLALMLPEAMAKLRGIVNGEYADVKNATLEARVAFGIMDRAGMSPRNGDIRITVNPGDKQKNWDEMTIEEMMEHDRMKRLKEPT